MSNMSESAIVIRDIVSIPEMRDVEDLQKEVWGLDERDIVPITQLVAATEVGGILIGAFDENTLIGFVYGFWGSESGHLVVHSHMLAVKSAYRNLDVGYKLKLAQRERALAQGITRITWTFDPLQSLNAHFNFAKLGVIADRYKINFYGEATSSFLHQNTGGTDRLWVTWLLNSRRVEQRLERRAKEELSPSHLERAAPLVQVGVVGSPQMSDLAQGLTQEYALIEIPTHISALQQQAPALVTEWREATRKAFTEAFAAGYLVEDFYRLSRGGQPCGAYLLSLGRTVEDFLQS
jgi:predicted GNAT superfamily acetyltransferase